MFDTIRAYTEEHEVTYIGVSTENNGISLGGQDCKIIYLDSDYKVRNFSMNDKCAAGA